MKAITEAEYRQTLHDNMTMLDRAIASGAIPRLSALLLSHGKSLYRKLSALHRYFYRYGEDERQRLSYYEGRGWEMMLSYDVMTTLGAGRDKATWEKAVLKLCALQMLGCFRPRGGEYSYLNSGVQQLSADRAEAEGRKPVMWYRVPRYTDKLLRIAEEKAEAVRQLGSGIDKDAIRDAWGAVMANRITDTGYGIHEQTENRRKALEISLKENLKDKGYAISKDVLEFARYIYYTFEFEEGYSYKIDDWQRWRDTYKAYKPALYADLGLKEGRPTKAEKQRWGLDGDSWIIRQR